MSGLVALVAVLSRSSWVSRLCNGFARLRARWVCCDLGLYFCSLSVQWKSCLNHALCALLLSMQPCLDRLGCRSQARGPRAPGVRDQPALR